MSYKDYSDAKMNAFFSTSVETWTGSKVQNLGRFWLDRSVSFLRANGYVLFKKEDVTELPNPYRDQLLKKEIKS